MRSIAAFAVLSLLSFALALEARAQDLPDPQAFQSSLTRTQQALDEGDVDAVMDAMLDLHEQVVRTVEPDRRLLSVIDLIPRVTILLDRSLERGDLVDFMRELNEKAEETERYRNVVAWGVVEQLYDLMMDSGASRQARGMLRDVIDREEALVGPEYSQIRTARTWLVQAVVATGDTDEALDLLDELLDATVGLYGEGAAETAEILTTMAQVHGLREEYTLAIRRADEAAAIVMRNPVRHARLPQQLGDVFRHTAQLDKARDMFQVMERLMSSSVPSVAVLRWLAQLNLAEINARLGDGASAVRYLNAARDQARNVSIDTPEIRIDTITVEAQLFALAGMFEEARASLDGLEAYGASEGLSERPAFKAALAHEYLLARAPERAAELAAEAMALVDRDTDLYTSAGWILAAAGALLEPPEPRLALARDLLDRAERENPERSHAWERYVVAINLAAEGRWEESAAMQREIIDAEAAHTSRYMTNHLQWDTYATALDRLGRSEERNRVATNLERDRAPLRDALAGRTAGKVFVEERSGFGFEVSLDDDGWQRARGANLGLPSAAFAATYSIPQRPNGGTFALIPVMLSQGTSPRTIIEAYDQRLFASLSDMDRWTDGVLEGYEGVVTDRDSNGQEVVRSARVIVEPGLLYLLIGVARAGEPETVAAVAEAFDRVTILPGASLESLSAEEREHHGRVMNAVGVSLFGLGRYPDARDMYREASRYLDTDYVVKNLMHTQYMLGEYESVIELSHQYEARYRPDRESLLWRADAYLNTRDYERALTDYKVAFDMGATGDGFAGDYVDLLLRVGRAGDAADFLDDYSVANRSLAVHGMQALTGHALGDEERLDDALDVLLDPGRSNPGAAYYAAVIIDRRDGYAGLLRLSRQLREDNLASADLYVLLATRQLQSGRYDDAGETIEEGLAVFPGNSKLEALGNNLVDDGPPEQQI